VQRLLILLAISFTLLGRTGGQKAVSPILLPGAKLYISPMEWNLDRFVTAEIQRQGLPVKLVARPEDADFVMACQYQSLGSHFFSPGHYIQVRIVSVDAGKQVWFADANDYALFFARMRRHGPARAAAAIVRRLRLDMAASTH
jgi:hypothetical protein